MDELGFQLVDGGALGGGEGRGRVAVPEVGFRQNGGGEFEEGGGFEQVVFVAGATGEQQGEAVLAVGLAGGGAEAEVTDGLFGVTRRDFDGVEAMAKIELGLGAAGVGGFAEFAEALGGVGGEVAAFHVPEADFVEGRAVAGRGGGGQHGEPLGGVVEAALAGEAPEADEIEGRGEVLLGQVLHGAGGFVGEGGVGSLRGDDGEEEVEGGAAALVGLVAGGREGSEQMVANGGEDFDRDRLAVLHGRLKAPFVDGLDGDFVETVAKRTEKGDIGD